MPDFKMGSAVSAPTRPPLHKLTAATVTWVALEMEATVAEGRGLWTSTRTLPTTLPNSLTLDASRTPSTILTGCSLREPTTILGTTRQIGKLLAEMILHFWVGPRNGR